jgi:hypothetical protein
MSSKPPVNLQGILPQSTIVPQDDTLFIPYFTRTYEAISQSVNAKDGIYFLTAITDTPTNIPNIQNFGSYIICVSGATTGLPCLTAALCKSDIGAIGSIAPLTFQAGTTAPWAAATLTITSTATNFRVAHSVAGQSGNFNIRIIGTQ